MAAKYAEITHQERKAMGAMEPTAYHVYWVLDRQGTRVGYVYQKPLSRAGSKWRETGATQAWMAHLMDHRYVDMGEWVYFPTKAKAAAILLAIAERDGGK